MVRRISPHGQGFVDIGRGQHSNFIRLSGGTRLLLPSVAGLQALAFWMRRVQAHPTSDEYIADFRGNGGTGYWYNTAFVNLTEVWVRGAQVSSANYDSLMPIGEWVLTYVGTSQLAGGAVMALRMFADIAYLSGYTTAWSAAEKADPLGAFPSAGLAYQYLMSNYDGATHQLPDTSGNNKPCPLSGLAPTILSE